MALTDLTRISTSGIATGSTIDAPILRKDVSFRGSQVGVTSALFDSSENELNLKDNVKLTFGNVTNGDLRIYHDTSNGSYIREAGPGALRIQGDAGIWMQSTGNQDRITADNNAVNLFSGGTKRFNTTSTGAVVTGILTATSFSGGGGISAGVVTCTGLDLNGNGDVSGNFVIGGDLTVNGTTTTLDTNLTEVDRIEVGANSNTLAGIAVTQSGSADILRLYDGASQVVTVDDEGNVGLGINSPSNAKLQVHGGIIKISGHAYARVTINDGANEAFFGFENQGPLLIGNANADAQIRVQGTNDIFFQTGNTVKRLTIKGDTGNVGIGSDNPSEILTVHTASGNTKQVLSSHAGFSELDFTTANTLRADVFANSSEFTFTTRTAIPVVFRTNGTNERLRITSAGYVGIQTADPKSFFHASRPSTAAVTLNFGDPVAQIFQCEDSEFALGLHNASPYPLYIQGRQRTNAAREIVLNPLGGNVIVGGLSLGASGSFGMESNGHVRSVLASGTAGSTLFGAIYGVSNGFQIETDASNNQTYKFHNGSQDNLTINSSGELIGTNSYRYVYPGNYSVASKLARFMAPVNYASGVYWGGGNGTATSGTFEGGDDTNTGGNFTRNGTNTENNLGYADHPGLVPCSSVWRAQNNDSSSNDDGGWNKWIYNLPGDDWGYLSTVMVRRVGTETSGQFYHGCSHSHTLYQNGTAQTNPYFNVFDISALPADIWCLSIGVITGNGAGNNGDAGNNTMVGVFRLDTGQKIYNGDWFRMKDGETTQRHRVYLYYSTSSNAHLQFRQPGFYVMDGSEPSIAELSHGRLCFKAGTGIVPVEDA